MSFKLSKKKAVIFVALAVLVAGAATYFFVIKKDNGGENQADQTPSLEKQVDTLFGHLSQEADYSTFYALVKDTDLAQKLAVNAAGLTPKLVVLAPSNEAFAKDDMKAFESVPAPGKTEIGLYHLVAVLPAAINETPDLSLKDGQKLDTLAGRQLVVKNKGTKTYIIDTKGREALVDKTFATSAQGDRMYFIDTVLLVQ